LYLSRSESLHEYMALFDHQISNINFSFQNINFMKRL
jgi:hypothetical protein